MKIKQISITPIQLILLSPYLFSLILSNNIYSQKISFKVIPIAMFEMGEIKGDVAREAQLWYERDSLFL